MQRSRFSRRSRSRRSSSPALPEISLTPLIDTALTLLVIFMVTSPMMNNVIKVELPKSRSNEDQGSKQELIVYMDKHEKLFFNGAPVDDLAALIKKIKLHVGHRANQMVFVKADQVVSYGHVIDLVDHIKVVGGISYVALATKRA
jgi:biopolymer transport protein ExbD